MITAKTWIKTLEKPCAIPHKSVYFLSGLFACGHEKFSSCEKVNKIKMTNAEILGHVKMSVGSKKSRWRFGVMSMRG